MIPFAMFLDCMRPLVSCIIAIWLAAASTLAFCLVIASLYDCLAWSRFLWLTSSARVAASVASRVVLYADMKEAVCFASIQYALEIAWIFEMSPEAMASLISFEAAGEREAVGSIRLYMLSACAFWSGVAVS